MNRSTDRILTTHTGSLPRPAELVALLEGVDQQDVRGDEAFDRQVQSAVVDIVRQHVDVHVDVANDGEMSKVVTPRT
jgi:5-methyltetrahydropteroyltriglutamate--homocysteine methyltransferase